MTSLATGHSPVLGKDSKSTLPSSLNLTVLLQGLPQFAGC